jgi:head-tail adaptor
MNELTEEKRFALAAALLFRQLAGAYDDAADMLIRQVRRMHHKAKELMKLRQASHLQQSAELVSTLHNLTIAYQQDGTRTTALKYRSVSWVRSQSAVGALRRICDPSERNLFAAPAAVFSSPAKCIVIAS